MQLLRDKILGEKTLIEQKKMNSLKSNRKEIAQTFVLDRLALARRGTFGDGTTDEDYELFHARSLEVSKVADIGGVRQDYRIRSVGAHLQHQESRNLHLALSSSLSPPLFSLEFSDKKGISEVRGSGEGRCGQISAAARST